MIAVDTSALMAIVLAEAAGADCERVMQREAEMVISAGTVAEALIVGAGRNVSAAVRALIAEAGFSIMPVTADTARRIGDIYARWGRGRDPAGLNFGDSFAYDAAKSNGCALLFVGDDFAKTDLASAL